MAECGAELLRECEPIAAALDDAHRGRAYRDALAAAGAASRIRRRPVRRASCGRSTQTYDKSYVAFALAQSARHRRELLKSPLPAEVEARYARMAEESLAAQREIEASDTVPFEVFRTEVPVAGSVEWPAPLNERDAHLLYSKARPRTANPCFGGFLFFGAPVRRRAAQTSQGVRL